MKQQAYSSNPLLDWRVFLVLGCVAAILFQGLRDAKNAKPAPAAVSCVEQNAAAMADWLAVANQIPEGTDPALAEAYLNSYCHLTQAVQTALSDSNPHNVEMLMDAQEAFVALNHEVAKSKGGFGTISAPSQQVLETWLRVVKQAQTPAELVQIGDHTKEIQECEQAHLDNSDEGVCSSILFTFSLGQERNGYVADSTFGQNIENVHSVGHICSPGFGTESTVEDLSRGFACPLGQTELRLGESYYSLNSLGIVVVQDR